MAPKREIQMTSGKLGLSPTQTRRGRARSSKTYAKKPPPEERAEKTAYRKYLWG